MKAPCRYLPEICVVLVATLALVACDSAQSDESGQMGQNISIDAGVRLVLDADNNRGPVDMERAQPLGDIALQDSGQQPMSNDAAATPEPQASEALERAYQWLTGRFDSSEQAAGNQSYFPIQLTSCEVNAPELGDHVLYVEQASMDSPNQPYRQRLYVLSDGEADEVISTIYSLVNPGAAIGLCQRQQAATYDRGDVALRAGCEVYIQWNGTHFTGGTNGQACSSTLGGAAYATSEVILYADQMTSWDRGFDANDVQVWGATEGAYIFVRRTEEMNPEMPGPINLDGGETCEDALDLFAESQVIPDSETLYTHTMAGRFGATNDYNPLESSGLAPGCSVVYDAIGRDVVYAVDVRPGDQFEFRLTMPPGSAGGMYFLDSCENGTWPDNDMSGACGRAEYRSHGNCDFNDCAPLEWDFEWPLSVDGRATEPTTLFLVIDEVVTANAEIFRLEWARTRLDP